MTPPRTGFPSLQTVLACIVACSAFARITADGANPDVDWEGDAQKMLKDVLKRKDNLGVAKNVIIFVGDGMGVTTVTASRIYGGQKEGKLGEEHVFSVDNFPHVALSKTYDATHQQADSAGTGTAIFCGAKAPTGTVGMTQHAERAKCPSDSNKSKPLTQTSILQWSLDEGKSVGVVTTARVTHATPSAAYAHSADRVWESDGYMPEEIRESCDEAEDIASQLVTKNPNIRVILGGGRKYFTNTTTPDLEYGIETNGTRVDGRDLIQEWKDEKKGRGVSHEFVWNREQFMDVDPANTKYLMGLFEPSHMQYDIDRVKDGSNEPSISEMTEKAINMLSKDNDDKGYFLLVEGARIDHAHHNNKAKKALDDTVAFMAAVQKAIDITDDEETLIIVTADHSIAFTMGGYNLRGNPILGVQDQASIDEEPALDGKNYLVLMYAAGPGPYRQPDIADQDTEADEFMQTVGVQVEWVVHGGEDVAIYARGPMAHLFSGTFEQNYIAHAAAYASCVGVNKEHCDDDAQHELCTSDVTQPTFNVMLLLLCVLACCIRQ